MGQAQNSNMGHLKAWEAVHTCVLSRRWRDVWASASRLDIRQPCPCGFPIYDNRRTLELAEFVKNLLLRRRPLALMDSLRLCWIHKAHDGDAITWIAYAIRHGAEGIELSGEHHDMYPSLEYMSFIVVGDDLSKNRLRVLKLIHIQLDYTTLTQLCSRCTCLEELKLMDCQIPEATTIRSTGLKRLTMIQCQIPRGFLVYAPNIDSLHCIRPLGYVPWIENLGSPGLVRNIMHPLQRTPDEYPEYTELVSCNLKFLKLSRVHLDDTIIRQLCSRCTCLERLELENALVEGKEIGSTSLKYPTMISCKFAVGFRIQAPNLVLLRCIKPLQHFPQIQKMEFLDTATIVLEDKLLFPDCQWPQKEDVSDVNIRNESDQLSCNIEHYESDGSSSYYDSDRSASSDEEEDDCTVGYSEISREHIHKAYKYLLQGHKNRVDKSREGYYEKHGSKVSTDSGGVGILLSLSNVRKMDLLAHPKEVLLTRELKSCTDFKNLKTLSLGEWCITHTFDVLASMLGHSPNLENLFIHLDMAYVRRVDFNPRASLFKCTNLKTVNITCCKHDVMVHTLADFFSENSIANDKIFVHRTACSGCTGCTSSQAKRKAQSEAEESADAGRKLRKN